MGVNGIAVNIQQTPKLENTFQVSSFGLRREGSLLISLWQSGVTFQQRLECLIEVGSGPILMHVLAWSNLMNSTQGARPNYLIASGFNNFDFNSGNIIELNIERFNSNKGVNFLLAGNEINLSIVQDYSHIVNPVIST